MYEALSPPESAVVSREVHLGLSAEFYLQIEWLPGARIEKNEVILDPLYDEPCDEGTFPACDPKVRGFILNFVREYDDLEYINIGRIVERLSLSDRRRGGRRDVYVVEMKERGRPREEVKVVRMQKWGYLPSKMN